MKRGKLIYFFLCLLASCSGKQVKYATVPFRLDHNRMMVEAEVSLDDSSWTRALLWVDTGNPDFIFSEPFLERAAFKSPEPESQPFFTPVKIRLGGMILKGDSIRAVTDRLPSYLYNAMHYDGNIPSTLLKNYHIIFDYPSGKLTIAEPGILKPEGTPCPAFINPETGIIQMDAVIDGEKYSFALDNGASFSFIPDFVTEKLHQQHPGWSLIRGATGCANIWGWWPLEEEWTVLRIPEMQWGGITIRNADMVGIPPVFRGQTDVGTNYSRKSAKQVNGFIGPNIFKSYRVEISYRDSTIYFLEGKRAIDEMVISGLTLRPLNDGRYEILGVAVKDGKPVVEGVCKNDILLQIDDLKITGLTMGIVIDALRGNPGDSHSLLIERDSTQIKINADVMKLL